MEPHAYLKSGTNELKIMEYSTSGVHFGLNILKTSRVVSLPPKLHQPGNMHPAVIGLMNDHGIIVPVIDLALFLKLKDKHPDEHELRGRILITEFFGQVNGFLIDAVHYVHTIMWERVFDAVEIMGNLVGKYVIGIVRPDEEKMILLLDYEKIILDLSPVIEANERQKMDHEIHGENRKLLIAEDSTAVRDMLAVELSDMGFEVLIAKDGREAWRIYEQNRDLAMVVSDVEMPQLEGLSLTKMIKDDNPQMPVIVYSSIGDIGMKKRAEDVQADAHVTKLNVKELMDVTRELLS